MTKEMKQQYTIWISGGLGLLFSFIATYQNRSDIYSFGLFEWFLFAIFSYFCVFNGTVKSVTFFLNIASIMITGIFFLGALTDGFNGDTYFSILGSFFFLVANVLTLIHINDHSRKLLFNTLFKKGDTGQLNNGKQETVQIRRNAKNNPQRRNVQGTQNVTDQKQQNANIRQASANTQEQEQADALRIVNQSINNSNTSVKQSSSARTFMYVVWVLQWIPIIAGYMLGSAETSSINDSLYYDSGTTSPISTIFMIGFAVVVIGQIITIVGVSTIPSSQGWNIAFLIFGLLSFWTIIGILQIIAAAMAISEHNKLEYNNVQSNLNNTILAQQQNSNINQQHNQSNEDVLERINNLERMFNNGTLTEEEFTKAKTKLLDKL